jgi:hypothetical protein
VGLQKLGEGRVQIGDALLAFLECFNFCGEGRCVN